MRLGWVGCHQEGIPALEGLVEAGALPVAVLTLRPDLAANRSGAVDYAPLCARLGLPLHQVASINDDATVQLLRSLSLDVLFVIGWSQILRAPALRAARLGTIGAHASLLPRNRGSAPINWALIRGESSTGNSLIWLAEDVDAGDVIDQTEFPITPYDTCASLYERVAASNREMILRALPRLRAGERPGRPQPFTQDPVLPRRRPHDGRIDWTAASGQVYDFVRALTRPYPGAFSWLDGERWTVWRAARLPAAASAPATPGAILGPVISPDEAACGQAVACGDGGEGGGGPWCCSSSKAATAGCSRAGASQSRTGRAGSGNMTKRILVIAAHPDDELLGCGGTIALHTRAGDRVTAVIACEGESVRYGTAGVGLASHTQQAASVLGVAEVRALGFADQRLDTMAMLDVVVPLERIVRDVQPHIVYCQYGGDANVDHQILFKALLVATRPLYEHLEGVYAFDTASSTEWGYPRTFTPDTWIDISSTLDQKLAAMACYETEVRPYPHPRSLDALRHRAKAWGNQVCMDAAEVFMTVRRTMRNGQAPD